MQINISQIVNGWIVTLVGPQGQSPMYCKTYEEVLEQMKEVGQRMAVQPPTSPSRIPNGN